MSEGFERHGERWTDAELAGLDQMVADGARWPEIGVRLQRKPDAVRGRAMRLAFESYYRRPVDLPEPGPTTAGTGSERGER